MDVLVIVAEDVELLIVGPLADGLFALGIWFVVSQNYQSVAVFQADQTMVSLMTTAITVVLDAVITSSKLEQGTTREVARTNCKRKSDRQLAGLTNYLL